MNDLRSANNQRGDSSVNQHYFQNLDPRFSIADPKGTQSSITAAMSKFTDVKSHIEIIENHKHQLTTVASIEQPTMDKDNVQTIERAETKGGV